MWVRAPSPPEPLRSRERLALRSRKLAARFAEPHESNTPPRCRDGACPVSANPSPERTQRFTKEVLRVCHPDPAGRERFREAEERESKDNAFGFGPGFGFNCE